MKVSDSYSLATIPADSGRIVGIAYDAQQRLVIAAENGVYVISFGELVRLVVTEKQPA